MDPFKRFDETTLFENLVHRTRDLGPENFEGREKFIVSDLDIPLNAQQRIGRVVRSLDGISDAQIANGVFYVVFQCDSDALPVVRKIHQHGGTFVPHLSFTKTQYRFVNRLAYNAMLKTWEKGDRISHLDPSVHENICEALDMVTGVVGDYVEIGVYLGGSALTALNFLDELRLAKPDMPSRKAWLLDTFDGFNYAEAQKSADAIWADTHQLFGRDETIAYVDETLSGAATSFELIASNICAEELPNGIAQIAVANVDVDMYEPTIAALNKVADLIQPGGVILAEDPTCTPGLYGGLLAMDEFLQSEKGKSFVKIFKGGHYFLIKKGLI